MAQKFMTNPVAGGCDLSSSEENVWGFGQTLPMFFLLIPGLSALETYFEVKTAEMATLHPGPVVPPQAHIPSHHSASTVTEPSEEHKLLSYPSPNQSNSEYSRAKQRSPNPPNLANDASGANLGTHDEQIQFTPQDEWLRRPTRIDTEMRIGTELPQGDSGTASILTGVEEHPFQPARRHIASSTG
ncbi:hypothetical protein MMC19_003397 [Ptychographa xylographoides]|nr:hypothetical protein [Ptychographa xylographoides]